MTLAEKVEVYLKRIKDQNLPSYPLKEKGLYRLVGGSLGGDYGSSRVGNKTTNIFYQGRFIDAIAEAVQNSDYFGEWCSDIGDTSNGFVEKIVGMQLAPNKELLKELKGRRLK